MPVTAPKLMIIGRDGILNHFREDHVKEPEELEPIPGALEAVAQLNHAGWHVVLATNQPGLGRGLFDAQALMAIHAKMHRQLATLGGRIDAVFYCPHTETEGCNCRKPASGLIEQIRDRYGAEGDEILVVGSCLAHLQAASELGAQLHMVCTGRSAHLDPRQPLPPGWPPGTRAHASLGDLVDSIATQPAPP